MRGRGEWRGMESDGSIRCVVWGAMCQHVLGFMRGMLWLFLCGGT